MKNKKSIIILISIISFLIIALGAFFIIFTSTDIFKTDEQLFYKYFADNTKTFSQFDNTKELNYLNKVRNISHVADGKISVSTNIPNDDLELLKLVNSFNITFSTKNDNVNKEYEGTIKLNYNDNINLPFDFKIVDNIIALKSDSIVNNYLAIEYNKLEQFDMPKIDLKEYEEVSKYENIKKIYEDIKTVLTTSISKNNFSKTKDGGYELVLKNNDIDNIISKMSSYLSTYTFIPAEIRENFTKELVTQCQLEVFPDIHIIVYKDGNIKIRINDCEINVQTRESSIIITQNDNDYSMTIRLNKQLLQDHVKNEIDCEIKTTDLNAKFNLAMNCMNMESQNSIEKYVIGVKLNMKDSQELDYNYTIDIKRDFNQAIKIELEKDKCIIINNLDNDTLNTLMQALMLKYTQINQLQMKQLGVQYDPILYVTPYGYIMNLIMKSTNETNSSMMTQMNNQEIDTFNAMFVKYEGTKKKLSEVKNIYETMTIARANNECNLEMTIDGNVANASIIANLDSKKLYTIKLYKGQDGRYNKIVVETI